MNKNTFFKFLIINIVLLIVVSITNICYGASIVINAGSTDLTVGSATTLTITGNDIIGKISITSSNPNVISLSSNEEWLEGVTTVKATAKSAGSAYITVTSVDTSSASTGEEVSAAAGANLTAKQIVTQAPSNNTNTQNNNVVRNTENTVVDTRSTNNYLSSLKIEGVELSPAFNADTGNYTAKVKSDVSELKVSAVPADDNSRVVVDGNLDLVSGENNVTISVTAENGYKRVYTIVVTKEKDPNDTDATISMLDIKNAKIKGEFKSDLFEYMCDDITADITKLEFDIKTKVPDLKYEITGNDELKTGINHITITVTSRDGSTKKEYKIIVYKTEEVLAMQDLEEEPVEEEIQTTSFIDKLKQRKGLVIIGISILVLIIVIVVIVLVIKKKKQRNSENQEDEWLKSDDIDYDGLTKEKMGDHEINEESIQNIDETSIDESFEVEEKYNSDIQNDYYYDVEKYNEEDIRNEEIEDEPKMENEYDDEEIDNIEDIEYNEFNDYNDENEEKINNEEPLEEEIIIRTGSLKNNKKDKKDKEEKNNKNHEVNIKLDLSSLKDDSDDNH